MPEYTTGKRLSPEHATNAVHGIIGWCAPTSLLMRSARLKHLAQTTICPKDVQRCCPEQSYS